MNRLHFLATTTSYISTCFVIIISFVWKVPLSSCVKNMATPIYCVDIDAINNARFMPKIDPFDASSINQATETITQTLTETQTITPETTTTPTIGTLTQTLTVTTTITPTINLTITNTVISTITPTTTLQTATITQPSFTPIISLTHSPTQPQASPTPIMIDTPTPTMAVTKDTPTITSTLFPLTTLEFLLTKANSSAELQAIQYEPGELETIKNGTLIDCKNIYRFLMLGLILLIWVILGAWFLFLQKNK
jgi:hypothetical protein